MIYIDDTGDTARISHNDFQKNLVFFEMNNSPKIHILPHAEFVERFKYLALEKRCIT